MAIPQVICRPCSFQKTSGSKFSRLNSGFSTGVCFCDVGSLFGTILTPESGGIFVNFAQKASGNPYIIGTGGSLALQFLLGKSEDSKHAAGLTPFGAIGEIPVKVAGGADARAVNLFDSGSGKLALNFGAYIHLIMARTDARTDERGAIGGIGSKGSAHGGDGVAGNVELGAFFAGVDERNGASVRINDENWSAVGAADHKW